MNIQPLAIFKSTLSTLPFLSLILLQDQVGGFQPPHEIATQTWILTAIGGAMGLVKIGIWLRDGFGKGGTDERSKQSADHQEEARRMLESQAKLMDKIVDTNLRIASSQEKLAESQQRSFELGTRMLESLTITRLLIENQSQMFKSTLENIASQSVNEIKEQLNKKL